MDTLLDIDDAWDTFCDGDYDLNTNIEATETDIQIPDCGEIYISTKTKIAYLNKPVDLDQLFWKLDVIPYYKQCEGIIKKQMKIVSLNKNEMEINKKNIEDSISKYNYVDENIIRNNTDVNSRNKYKDVRKISIGLCKKDIMSYKCKKKGAFYNCFVTVLRVYYDGKFKEVHIKVFNTGKLEIPGVQNNKMLYKSLDLLCKMLNSHGNTKNKTDLLKWVKTSCKTVLINSNFNCGYLINRENLYNKLKYKYNINCAYDPCSYPGIQCSFYYDSNFNIQTDKNYNKNDSLTKMSFMIFRTGSVLIVGKCDEDVLYKIYNYLKEILITEFKDIYIGPVPKKIEKSANKKNRKKYIYITC